MIVDSHLGKIEDMLKDYAHSRKYDVSRSAETPEFAGLLLQQFGYGVCDTIRIIYDSHESSRFYGIVDRLVEEIDPLWRENAKKRWSLSPAAVGANS